MRERVDPWLLLSGFAACGAAVALEPAACLPAVALALVLCWRRGARGLLLIALLLLGWQCARAEAALDHADAHYAAAVAALPAPRRCQLEATVVRSPVVARVHAPARSPPEALEGSAGAARVDVAVVRARCDEDLGPAVALPPGLRARLHGAPEWLRRGDRIDAIASLAPVRLFANPSQLDPRVRLSLDEVVASGGATGVRVIARGASAAAWIDEARAHVRRRIEASYPPAAAPLARALMLGETDLADDERAAFRDSGLSHLLAVSGTHLIIAVVALGRGLRALLARWPALAGRVDVGRVAAVLSALFAWAYASFAGGEGSAQRAAAMLSCAMLARAAGRRPSVRRCFAWSLLAGVAVHPLAPFDLSFALSLAATAGLLWAQARDGDDGERGWWSLPVGAVRATVAAMLACAPIVLTMSPALPLLGVAANLIAAPVGELLALPIALLHGVSAWWPALERGLAIMAAGALWTVRAVAHATRDAPWGTLPLPPPDARQLAALAAGVLAWRLALSRRGRIAALVAAVVALAALEIDLRRDGAPRGVLRVTVLDVGQGDAILVDLPDGSLMMVDGGGLAGSPIDIYRRVLAPELRARRRQRVDVLVVSHPHPDHYGGVLATLAQTEVGALWSSGLEAQQQGALWGHYRAAAARGVRLQTARALCGRPLDFGGAVVRVLAPCPDASLGQSANDNSLVLHITYGRHAVLLTGDAEAAAETALLSTAQPLRADLLKVGHHGSHTSSGEAFLRAVAPRDAVISCGVRNRFGHPHAATLRAIAERGARLWRTDRHGAFCWQSDGERVEQAAERP